MRGNGKSEWVLLNFISAHNTSCFSPPTIGHVLTLKVLFLLETAIVRLLDTYAVTELSFQIIVTHSSPRTQRRVRNQWLKKQNLNSPQSVLTFLSQLVRQHWRSGKSTGIAVKPKSTQIPMWPRFFRILYVSANITYITRFLWNLISDSMAIR